MSFRDIDWDDLSEKECKGRRKEVLEYDLRKNVYFMFNERKRSQGSRWRVWEELARFSASLTNPSRMFY